MIRKLLKTKIILLLFILCLTSCVEEETQQLINSSITAGNLLSDYYDKLIKYTFETWEMETFNSSLREIDFNIEQQNEYQKTITHLEERKKLITTFTQTLSQAELFVQNKSADDFKKTATELSNTINDIKPLKDNAVILPSDIFGNLANDITEIYRFFEIKYICKTLMTALEKIKELYEKEQEYYLSIITERNNKSVVIIRYLIDNEMVVPWGLIEASYSTFELDLAVEKKPAKDEKTKTALKKVLDVKYVRMQYLTEQASDNLTLLLTDLIKSYNEFIQGKKLIFDNIAYISNKTAGYLSGLNEYYIKLTGGGTNTGEIIYHGNSDSKVFHNPNCPYYFSKNSDVIFHSREEAIAKGYTACKTCNP